MFRIGFGVTKYFYFGLKSLHIGSDFGPKTTENQKPPLAEGQANLHPTLAKGQAKLCQVLTNTNGLVGSLNGL